MVKITTLGTKAYLFGNLGLVIFIPISILAILITVFGMFDNIPGSLLFLSSISIVILSIFYLNKEKNIRKLHGLIYETEDKEKFYIYMKESNGEIIVFVNGRPMAQFRASGFNRNHASFIIGKNKKYTVIAEGITNLFTGRIDIFLYIDGVLAYKVVNPVW